MEKLRAAILALIEEQLSMVEELPEEFQAVLDAYNSLVHDMPDFDEIDPDQIEWLD